MTGVPDLGRFFAWLRQRVQGEPMLLSMLEKRVDELVGDLACYHGHRTLWLDAGGDILHAEPDDMLEELGFEYIATLLQPDRDQLTSALLRMVPVEADRAIVEQHSSWHQAGVAAASLMPA